MFSFIQLVLCLTALNYVSCIPFFGEFRFRKNFEVEHKPILFPPFKPIELIKEIVTPFGKFGMKHAIGKRDLDNIKTVELEPENVSLKSSPGADNRYEVVEAGGPVPPMPTGISPMMGSVYPGMGPVVQSGPVPPQSPPHFVEIKPIPAPPPPPVVITPPPAKFEQSPPKGFFTDIAREEAVNEYLKLVEREPVIPIENNIEPEKPKEAPKVEEPPNPIVRGSRLALYFGNILLDVFTQLLGGGRFGEILNRPVTI